MSKHRRECVHVFPKGSDVKIQGVSQLFKQRRRLSKLPFLFLFSNYCWEIFNILIYKTKYREIHALDDGAEDILCEEILRNSLSRLFKQDTEPSRLGLLNTLTAPLQRRIHNGYPGYNTKKSDGEAQVKLELWENA